MSDRFANFENEWLETLTDAFYHDNLKSNRLKGKVICNGFCRWCYNLQLYLHANVIWSW